MLRRRRTLAALLALGVLGTSSVALGLPWDVDMADSVAVKAYEQPMPPLPVGALRNDDDPAADFEAQKRFTPWTSMWNVTGSTAISLPLHQTPDGLPVGVMLAAAPGREDLLLSLAAQVEAAVPWLGRQPDCW